MADFSLAYSLTNAHEAGYVHDPDDYGGETWDGISRRFNPDWPGWMEIDAKKSRNDFPECLKVCGPLQTAKKRFYKQRYWDVFDGDNMHSQTLANELYDTGVNMSPSRAVEFLQTALNCLNRHGEDLDVDGSFGPKTAEALDLLPGKEALIFKIMNVLQGHHYVERMLKIPSQRKYRGWFNRVEFVK